MLREYFPFAPSANATNDAKKLREAFSSLHELINSTVPMSDEKHNALTSLRTASMWAIAGVIAHHPDHDADETDEPTVLVTEDVEIGGVQ